MFESWWGHQLNSKTIMPIQILVTSIIQATPKIKIFRLQYGEIEFSFRPGQWIDLQVPIEGKNIGGYTIISSVHEKGYIDIAVRESTTHPVTKFLHQILQIGDHLNISHGRGNFFITDELLLGPLTFLAGGIGITPILSMLRSVDKSITPVQLFYSVSLQADILFANELSPWTTFCITKDILINSEMENQRISIELLKKHKVNFNSHFFICGPKAMIETLVSDLQNNDVSLKNIHFEKWW